MIHDSGRIWWRALCGSAKQALAHKAGRGRRHHRARLRGRRPHRRDRQHGALARGHRGRRADFPCSPRAESATAGRSRRRWLMGAQGAWTGSIWLTVTESSSNARSALKESATSMALEPRHGPLALGHRQAGPHAAQRLDRGLGATRRTPEPLADAAPGNGRARHDHADQPLRRRRPGPVAFNPVGQIVGRMNQMQPVRERDVEARG